jgi:hypothetical protein
MKTGNEMRAETWSLAASLQFILHPSAFILARYDS